MLAPQQRVKTEVVWVLNPQGDPPVIGWINRIIVFPSAVGQSSPISECYTRTELPLAGTLEMCELFLNQGGRSYVAYPRSDAPVLHPPGASSPIEISWQENTQQEGCIASRFLDEAETRYVRIFPAGENPHNPPGSANWAEKPKPGETNLCLVQYVVAGSGSVVGYAYPFVGTSEEVEVEIHRGVVHIDGVGMFIPCETGWQVEVQQEEDEVHIVLRREPDLA